MISYAADQCEVRFGGRNFLANLGTALDTGFSLPGNVTVDRRTVLGQVGRTADPVDAGYTFSAALRYNDEVEKLETNRIGHLLIRRNDSKFAYVIPMLVSDFPFTSPAAGAVTMNVPFTQGAHALAAGVNFGTSGQKRLVALSGTSAKSIADITANDVLFIMRTDATAGAGNGADVQKSGSTVTGGGDVGAAGPGLYYVEISANTGLTVKPKKAGFRGTAFVGKILEAA